MAPARADRMNSWTVEARGVSAERSEFESQCPPQPPGCVQERLSRKMQRAARVEAGSRGHGRSPDMII